jgi:hypothetical protein
MGGPIVRRVLLDSDEVRRRIGHVLLFGTPSNAGWPVRETDGFHRFGQAGTDETDMKNEGKNA